MDDTPLIYKLDGHSLVLCNILSCLGRKEQGMLTMVDKTLSKWFDQHSTSFNNADDLRMQLVMEAAMAIVEDAVSLIGNNTTMKITLKLYDVYTNPCFIWCAQQDDFVTGSGFKSLWTSLAEHEHPFVDHTILRCTVSTSSEDMVNQWMRCKKRQQHVYDLLSTLSLEHDVHVGCEFQIQSTIKRAWYWTALDNGPAIMPELEPLKLMLVAFLFEDDDFNFADRVIDVTVDVHPRPFDKFRGFHVRAYEIDDMNDVCSMLQISMLKQMEILECLCGVHGVLSNMVYEPWEKLMVNVHMVEQMSRECVDAFYKYLNHHIQPSLSRNVLKNKYTLNFQVFFFLTNLVKQEGRRAMLSLIL